MFRTLFGFLQHHGFRIMMAGFGIIAVCALVYSVSLVTHHSSPALKNTAYSIALVGLVIYVLGRILGHLDNKSKSREAEKTPDSGKESK